MSLNQIVNRNSKHWLNVRGYNVKIDGNLSVENAVKGYALNYHGVDDVRFSPIDNLQNITHDMFYITPVQNTSGGYLDCVASPFAATNFTIDVNNDLVCVTAGNYLVSFKTPQAAGFTAGYLSTQIRINASAILNSTNTTPLCTTTVSNVPSFAGGQNTTLVNLAVNDVLSLFTVVSSGTISLQNTAGASNIILVYLG